MKVYRSLDELPSGFAASAVTIGKFDAIHLGHRTILSRLGRLAKREELQTVVVTFSRHPFELLDPARVPQPILGATQKLELLKLAGVDNVLLLDFDEALASRSAEDFITDILVERLNAKLVMVGEGFRFGSGGAGDCQLLSDLASPSGYDFASVEPVVVDGEVVSTSAIRTALDEGDIAKANLMLGRKHLTIGSVEHGLKIGRTIGFPTANISREAEGYLPRDGVYAGWMHTDGRKLPTAISIGINETFQAVPRLAEAFVIDATAGLDLYDKVVTLEYVSFVRPAAKFDGVDSLVAEIKRDIEKIRSILALT
ncbi:MAG: bifunctional riboflavin kinase/FAD synthetase [Micrococcales bacterium]